MPGSQGVVRQSIRGNALFLFFITSEGEGPESEVQDGCLLAQVTLWIMCVEHCLVQLSTLHSKRPFFNPSESHPLTRTLLHSKPPPPLPLPPHDCRTPAPSCPASPGCSPSASCGPTGAGWRWTPAPVLRRHLFSIGMRVCWCWLGGAEGPRVKLEGPAPPGEEEIKE